MSILKFKVSYSNTYGRYLIADDDIASGELIFSDEPIVVGPLNVKNVCLCFSCMKFIFATRYTCSSCKIAPLCGDFCEKNRNFHSSDECELFSKNKDLIKNNLPRLVTILMHLRLWLVRKTNPKLWQEIDQMEAHLKERREKPVWNDVQSIIIKTFEDFNIIPINDKESSELIQKISGILDVNTFEIRLPSDIHKESLRGLYLDPSLMAHRCVPNTHIVIGDKLCLKVYASVPIKKDEAIFFNYTSPFMGFADRQTYLREGKYFDCQCSLCQDPTEGGTSMSTILCPKCKKDCVIMIDSLSRDPYSKLTKWKCQTCGKFISGHLVKTTLDISERLINNCNEQNVEIMEILLKKLSSTLHSNHFFMLNLKHKLFDAYKLEFQSNYVENKELQQMIKFGNDLLTVLNVMEPGISRLRGILLYEMSLPMTVIFEREYSLQKITSNQLILKLKKIKDSLTMSYKILSMESPMSPEGWLTQQITERILHINQMIKDVESLPESETN